MQTNSWNSGGSHVAEWKLETTEADIDAALKRARLEPELPRAISAEYDQVQDAIVLQIDDGRRLVIPRKVMQGLESATESQLSQIEIYGGSDIAWPQLDVDHNLRSLLVNRYGSEKWMKSLKKSMVAA
jgi:hypothetical protein